MTAKQLVQPNLDPVVHEGGKVLLDWYGWCLATVEAAFNTPQQGATAWAEWTAIPAAKKHADRNLPVGVYVPIWFSGYGGAGHVAIAHLNANGSMNVWTSPWTHKPYFDTYSSIDALAHGYNVVYAGWSESLAGVDLISIVADPAPAAPTQPAGQTLHLPASAATWRVYKVGGPYTVGHEIAQLKPSQFGGLSYPVQKWLAPDVAQIATHDFGVVAIYTAPSTGATLS